MNQQAPDPSEPTAEDTTQRQQEWVATMHGSAASEDLVLAHRDAPPRPSQHMLFRVSSVNRVLLRCSPVGRLALLVPETEPLPKNPTSTAPVLSVTATASSIRLRFAVSPARPKSSSFPTITNGHGSHTPSRSHR